MKISRKTILASALVLCAAIIIAVGCSSNPPNKFDSMFYNITTNPPTLTSHTITNFVTQTNQITQTNQVTLTNTVTGEKTITNVVTEYSKVSTNPVVLNVTVTNAPTYNYTPNENAEKVKGAAGAIGNIVAPGIGGPIATAIVGLIATGYAWIRGNKQRDTAANLAQGIETSRELIRLAVPDGKKYDAAFVQWLKEHQADAGVVKQVTDLLAKEVDSDSAAGAASNIVNSAVGAFQAQAPKT